MLSYVNMYMTTGRWYEFRFQTRAEAEDFYRKLVDDIETKKFIELNYNHNDVNGLITFNTEHIAYTAISDGTTI